MGARIFETAFKMAALAAIFIALPSAAVAEVCDKGDLLADFAPALYGWLEASPHKDWLRPVFMPGSWIIVGLLIWLISSDSPRPAIVASVWFTMLGCLSVTGYFMIDLTEPYYQAASQEGCLQTSPPVGLVSLALAAGSIFLAKRRLRRRAASGARAK